MRTLKEQRVSSSVRGANEVTKLDEPSSLGLKAMLFW